MANEIQLQGRNGDKSFGERADIRAAPGNSSWRVAAYPVIRAAARICPFVEAAVIDAQSLPGEANAAQFHLPWDVEQCKNRPGHLLSGQFRLVSDFTD